MYLTHPLKTTNCYLVMEKELCYKRYIHVEDIVHCITNSNTFTMLWIWVKYFPSLAGRQDYFNHILLAIVTGSYRLLPWICSSWLDCVAGSVLGLLAYRIKAQANSPLPSLYFLFLGYVSCEDSIKYQYFGLVAAVIMAESVDSYLTISM